MNEDLIKIKKQLLDYIHLILKEYQPNQVTVTLNKPKAVADTTAVGVQISKKIGE